MSRTHKHEQAWHVHHDHAQDATLLETKKAGRRFGNKRRLFARLKIKLRRAFRRRFKQQKPESE
jgi:hypothetical protein